MDAITLLKNDHAEVRELLGELAETTTRAVKKRKELVEHHANEEEKEMFPRAKKLLSKDELAELGARLEARKEELLAAA